MIVETQIYGIVIMEEMWFGDAILDNGFACYQRACWMAWRLASKGYEVCVGDEYPAIITGVAGVVIRCDNSL